MSRATTLVYVLLAGAVVLWFFGVGVEAGFGQTAYAQDCPAVPTGPGEPPYSLTDAAVEVRFLRVESAQACAALAERLEALVVIMEASAESETTTAAQRVALATVDRNRLDLAWWGEWALVGTAWGLAAGFLLLRAFRFWRE